MIGALEGPLITAGANEACRVRVERNIYRGATRSLGSHRRLTRSRDACVVATKGLSQWEIPVLRRSATPCCCFAALVDGSGDLVFS